MGEVPGHGAVAPLTSLWFCGVCRASTRIARLKDVHRRWLNMWDTGATYLRDAYGLPCGQTIQRNTAGCVCVCLLRTLESLLRGDSTGSKAKVERARLSSCCLNNCSHCLQHDKTVMLSFGHWPMGLRILVWFPTRLFLLDQECSTWTSKLFSCFCHLKHWARRSSCFCSIRIVKSLNSSAY